MGYIIASIFPIIFTVIAGTNVLSLCTQYGCGGMAFVGLQSRIEVGIGAVEKPYPTNDVVAWA